MITLAIILNLLVAIGVAAFGALYLIGPVPNRHHRAILEWRDLAVDGNLAASLVPIYRIAGAALMSTATGLAGFALFAQVQGDQWAFAVALVMVLLSGVPAVLVARRSENVSGIRTPWRPAAALTAVAALAFLLALV